jgi:hypothetical protein
MCQSQENWEARWARAVRCWQVAALCGGAAVVALAVPCHAFVALAVKGAFIPVYCIRYIHRYIYNLRYKWYNSQILYSPETGIFALSAAAYTVRGSQSAEVVHNRVRNRAMRHKHSFQQVLLMGYR